MTRVTRTAPTAQPHPPLAGTTVKALKIVVLGGFGAGKTTMVRSVSEIRPLHTEEVVSRTGHPLEDTTLVRGKNATTVAFDFGRITIDERSVLYLFGAPGQERFWFLWERLFAGTLGAVVLVDTRSLTDACYTLDRLEHHGTPFIVAVNDFGGPFHSEDRIRDALALGPDVPLVEFDARDHSSSKFVLIALIEHLHALAVRRDQDLRQGAHPDVRQDG
ncbi:ATP/GTP-binding protein [Streptomyces sp. NBC_01142]|uniref:GTP-binding protein n=1 Tax=Streptomyces sp. NBC_01142 TaxID=2975865 RepID=UPI00225B7D61|nr:ATP/GTP-binding protein [Streptomyces sp. NBC_01142]MCX4823895.1 ATP/GTP-binding protein [Streptomyces sp. NBC_01142]